MLRRRFGVMRTSLLRRISTEMFYGAYILMEWLHHVFASHQQGQARKVFSTLRPRQNGRHFPDDILKRISLNENV